MVLLFSVHCSKDKKNGLGLGIIALAAGGSGSSSSSSDNATKSVTPKPGGGNGGGGNSDSTITNCSIQTSQTSIFQSKATSLSFSCNLNKKDYGKTLSILYDKNLVSLSKDTFLLPQNAKASENFQLTPKTQESFSLTPSIESLSFSKKTFTVKNPLLSWKGQSNEGLSEPFDGQFSSVEILNNIDGDKQGFSIKEIKDLKNLNPSSAASLNNGSKSILQKATGSFTGDIVLEHNSKSDVTLDDVKFTMKPINFLNLTYGVVITPTGRSWLDRNLGAERVAQAFNDQRSYGFYYQFGRGNDGHQLPTSTTIGTKFTATTEPIPANNRDKFFILENKWHATFTASQIRALWRTFNNPCPAGFEVPTIANWETENNANTWQDRTGANQQLEAMANSPLKIPSAGFRDVDGSLASVGATGILASESLSGNPLQSSDLFFSLNSVTTNSSDIITKGLNVRCIKKN